jgi:hypothetical protein
MEEIEDGDILPPPFNLAEGHWINTHPRGQRSLGQATLPSIVPDGGTKLVQRRVLTAGGGHRQTIKPAEKGGDAERRP